MILPFLWSGLILGYFIQIIFLLEFVYDNKIIFALFSTCFFVLGILILLSKNTCKSSSYQWILYSLFFSSLSTYLYFHVDVEFLMKGDDFFIPGLKSPSAFLFLISIVCFLYFLWMTSAGYELFRKKKGVTVDYLVFIVWQLL